MTENATAPHKPLRRHHPPSLYPLSTPLRPAFQGDNACWVLLAHLTHTSHDPFARRHGRSTHLHVSVEPHAHTLVIT